MKFYLTSSKARVSALDYQNKNYTKKSSDETVIHDGKKWTVYYSGTKKVKGCKYVALVVATVACSILVLGVGVLFIDSLRDKWKTIVEGKKTRVIYTRDPITPKNPSNFSKKTSQASKNLNFFEQADFLEKLTEFEKNHFSSSHFQRQVEDNIGFIKNRNEFGYNTSYSELITMYYMKSKGCLFLDDKGKNIEKAKISGSVCYTEEIVIVPGSESQKIVADSFGRVQWFLYSAAVAHWKERPAKILMPISMFPQGGENSGHSLVLVIEPDTKILGKAKITSINTHGNSLKSYVPYEKFMLEAARRIYHHPETTILRNEKATYAGNYCAIDMIENLLLLAEVNDVQAFIKGNNLPSRDRKEICACRQRHTEAVQKIWPTLKNLSGR